jgi:hypothetical protein
MRKRKNPHEWDTSCESWFSLLKGDIVASGNECSSIDAKVCHLWHLRKHIITEITRLIFRSTYERKTPVTALDIYSEFCITYKTCRSPCSKDMLAGNWFSSYIHIRAARRPGLELIPVSLTCKFLYAVAENERKSRQNINRLLSMVVNDVHGHHSARTGDRMIMRFIMEMMYPVLIVGWIIPTATHHMRSTRSR